MRDSLTKVPNAIGRVLVAGLKLLLFLVAALMAIVLLDAVAETLDVYSPFRSVFRPPHGPWRGAVVRSDLRNLLTANEAYFDDHGTYGTHADLTAAGLFTASSDVVITSTDGTRDGFSATGTSPWWPDGMCTVYVGIAPAAVRLGRNQRPEEVRCRPERAGAPVLEPSLGVLWIAGAFASAWLLSRQRRAGLGFLLGLLLGPVGVVGAAVLRRRSPPVARPGERGRA